MATEPLDFDSLKPERRETARNETAPQAAHTRVTTDGDESHTHTHDTALSHTDTHVELEVTRRDECLE